MSQLFHYFNIILFLFLVDISLKAQNCNSNEIDFQLILNQDNYPLETSWELFQNDSLIITGDTNSINLCLDTNHCYSFVIHDSYGDGICCGYGLGSYHLILNGDTITNIDLKKLIKKENTIAAIQLRTKFGILHTEQNKIIKFDEKKEIKDVWMNAGIYHLNRETINHLPTIGDIEKTLFPNYAKKEKLSTVKFTNVKWYSIDSFKDMEECSVVINKIIK